MEWLRNKRRQRNAGVYKTADLETPMERRRRWWSVRIVYFTMFIMTLGFSIVITGVWPFLDKLDPHAGKGFYGYVVAANPLGQMIFSPLFGYWCNKIGSVRIPMLTSLAMFTLSTSAYSLLELFPSKHIKYWMLASRFLVGASSANIAVVRSYLSSATTFRERTGAVSMLSLAQVLGFILGPAIQTAVSPLGDKGIPFFGGQVHLNMYTAAGWVNVLLAAINFILFLPCCFQEQPIAAKEAQKKQGTASEEDTWKSLNLDYTAVWSLVLGFFILSFNFVLLETLAMPLVMDQFAWTKEESIKYMGSLMTAGAVVALVTFTTLKPLTKRFDERSIMLYGGFFLMVVGRILHIPWGDAPPPLKTEAMIANANNQEVVGCPVDEQPWCAFTPAMTITQLFLGYFFTSVGYPIGITVIQTLFSKILGPRPQGVWQGVMTGSGCASRVLGPVFLSYIYVKLGTVWTFSLTTVMMALCCLWMRLIYSRLVPPQPTNTPIPLISSAQPPRVIVLNGSTANRAEEKDGKAAEELQALQ
ncbi:major facilitator superfamily domain-containing protein 8-like [Neocloeon triangulifer]|uniref:major facilitator superfamily domain-containing protein 8-like n=1 Tax=Neocloeon triangulifer TaxID=2078957 RepID=UPI00286F1648|nr:major facilitator superfamily domain-containing protein 8-like [Neocloeon triangulifer]